MSFCSSNNKGNQSKKLAGVKFEQISLSDALVQAQQKNKMVRGYPTVLFLNPDGEEINRIIGRIELAQKAAELEPKEARIWNTLAWLFFEKGELQKAIKAMNKAVELDPEREEFKKNLKKFEQTIS